MLKSKKLVSILLAAGMMVSALSISASADSVDRSYSINISSTYNTKYDGQFMNSKSEFQKKDNSTSSYVKAESGLSSFIAVIWGGYPNSEPLDCTSQEHYSGTDRTLAIVRVGQKGYVRQDVYEIFGGGNVTPVAQIFGKYHGSTGITTGVWSPDSVYESGCIDFNK